MNNVMISGLYRERKKHEANRGMKDRRIVEDGCMAAWMDGR